ncbi:MAG: hypothetical protein SGJ20_15765 [Planctomycetota bacterium]|nr:hypothetical protein [Planctomycetota bacterium]
MSSTDRAFIRAYGDDDMGSAKPLPPPKKLGPPTAKSAQAKRAPRTAKQAVDAPAAEQPASRQETQAAPQASPRKHDFSPLAAASVVPSPHAPFAKATQNAGAGVFPCATDDPREVQWRVDQQHPLVADLPSFNGTPVPTAPGRVADAVQQCQQVQAPTPLSIPAIASPHLAAYEVDQFAWPAEVLAIDGSKAQCIKSLASLLTSEVAAGRTVIGVAGTTTGEGCTTLLLAIARHLARGSMRPVIVDANFNSPALAVSLGLSIDQGLEAILKCDAAASDVLVESLADRLTLLPTSGPVDEHLVVTDMLRTAMTLGELRTQFDLVLVDMGAADLNRTGNGAWQAEVGIESALIVSDCSAAVPQVNEVCQQLDRLKIRNLGIVQNRCRAKV